MSLTPTPKRTRMTRHPGDDSSDDEGEGGDGDRNNTGYDAYDDQRPKMRMGSTAIERQLKDGFASMGHFMQF